MKDEKTPKMVAYYERECDCEECQEEMAIAANNGKEEKQ